MGMFFTIGETKKRPGVYQRYENVGTSQPAGATNGICAAVFAADWGPLNKVVTLSSEQDIAKTFGSAGTTQVLHEMFIGGALTVRAVRGGTGGTPGTLILNDTTASPLPAATIQMKYPGTRAFQCLLRDVAGDASTRELLLLENGATLERFTFPASTNGEVDALISAVASSAYFTITKQASYSGTGKLATVAQSEISGGTDPTLINESYSDALNLLEPFRFNAVGVDTSDTAVHAIVAGYIDRLFQEGKMAFAVIGEPTTVDYATRLAHSSAYNDYKIVYVGAGFRDETTGTDYDGFLAAARIAGMVAAIPSNDSLTHKVILRATDVMEMLTNQQLDDAIDNGMIVFSLSSTDQVWIDCGITTLVNPTGNDDAGWKKIRRVKTRIEIMTRSSDTTEGLSGNINNDADGRATVIQAVQGVLNEMVAEKKLESGATIALDSALTPSGDSAWFVIAADDIDSLEKMYFTFQFRFSSAS